MSWRCMGRSLCVWFAGRTRRGGVLISLEIAPALCRQRAPRQALMRGGRGVTEFELDATRALELLSLFGSEGQEFVVEEL